MNNHVVKNSLNVIAVLYFESTALLTPSQCIRGLTHQCVYVRFSSPWLDAVKIRMLPRYRRSALELLSLLVIDMRLLRKRRNSAVCSNVRILLLSFKCHP